MWISRLNQYNRQRSRYNYKPNSGQAGCQTYCTLSHKHTQQMQVTSVHKPKHTLTCCACVHIDHTWNCRWKQINKSMTQLATNRYVTSSGEECCVVTFRSATVRLPRWSTTFSAAAAATAAAATEAAAAGTAAPCGRPAAAGGTTEHSCRTTPRRTRSTAAFLAIAAITTRLINRAS